MATMAADPVFVDTNVLIYAQQGHSPFHAQAVTRLQSLTVAGNPLWISRQVLREYLAVMSRPGAVVPSIAMTALIADVQRFQLQFHVAEDGAAVTTQLLALLASVQCAGKQIHDANIVATMLAQGISHLLTHNGADFQRFGGITVIPMIP